MISVLQLFAEDLDICRIGKILGKYKIKSTITTSSILIDCDKLPAEVATTIFEYSTITYAQNYVLSNATSSRINPSIHKKEQPQQSIFDTDDYLVEDNYPNHIIEKPSVRETSKFRRVLHRGEVYAINASKNLSPDDVNPKECVIIIQDDYFKSTQDDTIALYCSSQPENLALSKFSFRLSDDILFDSSYDRLLPYDCCTFRINSLKGIKCGRLGKYLGTVNNRFMGKIQPAIDFHLGLKRSRTVNLAQLQIISTVNTNDLLQIAQSSDTIENKVTNLLNLFKFDFTLNGVNYLRDAIIYATQLTNYRLEDLATEVAKLRNINEDEVLRLITARIKEHFHLKQVPALSFIRLIDSLARREVIKFSDNKEGFYCSLATRLDFNQLELLDKVSFGEAFRISRSPISDAEKVDKYLILFGFDFEKPGVKYIRDAILIARQMSQDYCLEDLVLQLCNKTYSDFGYIIAIMNIRCKEVFQLRKSPVMPFITLIDQLLQKGC